MLRSRKLNAPGPNEPVADRWECGCEVYILFRPQVGMKEGGCIAANGDDASIILFDGMVEMTALRTIN
jgi:hypothetical protein